MQAVAIEFEATHLHRAADTSARLPEQADMEELRANCDHAAASCSEDGARVQACSEQDHDAANSLRVQLQQDVDSAIVAAQRSENSQAGVAHWAAALHLVRLRQNCANTHPQSIMRSNSARGAYCCYDYANGAPCFIERGCDGAAAKGRRTVLARYCQTGLPAAVKVDMPQGGRAVLCATHPELDADHASGDEALAERDGTGTYLSPLWKVLASDGNAVKRTQFLLLLLSELQLPAE